jgi:hypothetical protein
MARLFNSHPSANNDKAIEVRDWLAANGWTDVSSTSTRNAASKPASAGRKTPGEVEASARSQEK